MSQEQFTNLIKTITADISGKDINQELMAYMNSRFSTNSDEFKQLAEACRAGIKEGWLCDRELLVYCSRQTF